MDACSLTNFNRYFRLKLNRNTEYMMHTKTILSSRICNQNNVWIDDNAVTQCTSCKISFGLFVRKHHCRYCGNIFCYKCANHFIVIPDFVTDKPEATDYWNLSYYITSLKGDEERVCFNCYDVIKKKKLVCDNILKLFKEPKTIQQIRNAKDMDTQVKHHYINHLRNIQYYLPSHVYSDMDKNILRINATLFCGHSKYIVHLIKSLPWHAKSKLYATTQFQSERKHLKALIMTILSSEKIMSCAHLYCTRTCNHTLSCDDAMNILFSHASVLPSSIMKLLFGVIMQTPEMVLLCNITFFSDLVCRYGNENNINQYIYTLIESSRKLIYHMFWLLNVAKEKANFQETSHINHFLDRIDSQMLKLMHSEYLFYVQLVQYLDNPIQYLQSAFQHGKMYSLPYDPDIQLVGLKCCHKPIQNSHTQPIIISFHTNGHGYIDLLFKRDSIMKDYITLNIIALCDMLMQEHFAQAPHSCWYPVMPLTDQAGVIEIVQSAQTIYHIVNKRQTILQYLVQHNENNCMSDILNKYMYSLAQYTLQSYFLGIGDRHTQNIMITQDGSIFHIDFEYILGKDAYSALSPNIKLNAEMLDIIGGESDKRFTTYLKICAQGAILLRKYSHLFYLLLWPTCKNDSERQALQRFLLNKFQPRQTDEIVVMELWNIIHQSYDAYGEYVRDFIHYHSQQNMLQHMINRVKDVIKSTIFSYS